MDGVDHMRWFYIKEKAIRNGNNYNAGSKARLDLERIFESAQMYPIEVKFSVEKERLHAGIIQKCFWHLMLQKKWDQMLRAKKIRDHDVIVIQFPLINHTMFFAGLMKKLHRKKAHCIVFLHDLECLRFLGVTQDVWQRYRMNKEEVSVLKNASVVVAHNKAMKALLNEEYRVPKEKIVVLGIFDYLTKDVKVDGLARSRNDKSCVFAGNLSKEKAGFLYHLPKEGVFHLYGTGYEDETHENIVYHGKYLPEQLPTVIQGAFGVVWDGESSDTCEGSYGEYLRYNNPHKASLYLASGIPIIIWDQAALADFVLEHQVGITVSSLKEIKPKLDQMSEEEYFKLKYNAEELSKKLRTGWYTKKAIENCIKKLKYE